jgi:3-oxoacyl-[acyl-carrier-protein] synthase II
VDLGPDVWITGVGAATPLGSSYDTIASGLLAGRSGVMPVTAFNVADHPSQIAGQIPEIPCPSGLEPAQFANLPPLEQLALHCCTQALQDSGYWSERQDLRIGVVLGLGAEWLELWEADFIMGGDRICDPDQNTESLVNVICRKLDLSGPGVSVAAACASGNYAIAQARRWLQLGWVDVCLAGACDKAINPLSLAGFGNLRALSRRNHEPRAASRPFDRDRDGFVLAEGGAMFVLESSARAKSRGARPYGQVAGCGSSSDAHNMVIPSPDPVPAVAAMRKALDDARVAPERIDYINAHATGTNRGDAAEARVLESVLGTSIKKVPVSSTKSMTGHLLTAAAAVEALACLIAIGRRAVPPTINLEHPDPECDLCHVANTARERIVRIAVSNSFGFGGSNTCLVLKQV